jgi:hypothetical protein
MNMPTWKRYLTVASLLLLLAATACAKRPAPREVGGLDKKLSTFAFVEDGDLVALIVDTRAARYSEEASYMPLEISVANRGLKEMVLTRESFTLVDETGQKYPVVGPRELMENHDVLDAPLALAELGGIVDQRFATFTQYPSRFSPNRTMSLVRDVVTLPKFGYMVDFIYFPKPATGIKDHKFELQMTSPVLPPDNNPIFVKFMVL